MPQVRPSLRPPSQHRHPAGPSEDDSEDKYLPEKEDRVLEGRLRRILNLTNTRRQGYEFRVVEDIQLINILQVHPVIIK